MASESENGVGNKRPPKHSQFKPGQSGKPDKYGEPARDYEVGDRRPPKHSQFKPGVSGNPKGRPKGSVNLRTRVTRQLRESGTVTRNGRQVKMPKADLIALQIVDSAAKGDLKAAALALRARGPPSQTR